YAALDSYIENPAGPMNFMEFARKVAEDMVIDAAYTEHNLNIYPTDDKIVSIEDQLTSDLVVGVSFKDKSILQRFLNVHAIKNQYQFRVEKSCNKQYYVKCMSAACTWFGKASRVGHYSTFKIRELGTEHKCSFDVRTSSQRQATSNVVCNLIKSKFMNNKTSYTAADIIDDMQIRYGINLSYHKAWRSKRKAIDEVRGKASDSYDCVQQYLEKLRAANPGSILKLCATPEQNFLYVFMSLSASVKGWKCCRPIVVVDGTFLASSYGGILLTACCQDANFHILPLAFCVVDSENNQSYLWFFNKLQTLIGERDGLCIVSDGHESIKNAVEKVFPSAVHCLCTYHISNNIKKHYKKEAQAVKDSFHAAARAYTVEEYDMHMSEIEKLNPDVITYLEKIGVQKWARIHCPKNRYFTMTSNAAETVNSVTKSIRDLPITTLLDPLREMQQKWNVANREVAKATFTTLAKKPHNMLENNYKAASRFS
ncbi:Unknown protein, partial [Striga hermonthica]